MESFINCCSFSVATNCYTTIYNENMNCVKLRVWKFVGTKFEKKYIYQNTISLTDKPQPLPFDDIVRVLNILYPNCNIEFTCMFSSDRIDEESFE